MAFRPLNPLPTPDEVLEHLDPKPGESYGYITREDIRFGWLYFLSLAWNNASTPSPVTATAVVPAYDIDENYSPGTLVRYDGALWVSTMTIAPLGLPPGQTVQWQRVDSRPAITVALVAGQAPSSYQFDQIPLQGDVFINIPDRISWVRGPGGWQQILVQESARPYAEAMPIAIGSAAVGWTKWSMSDSSTDPSGVIVVNPAGMVLNKTGIFTVNFIMKAVAPITAQIRLNDTLVLASQTSMSSEGQATVSTTSLIQSGLEVSPYVNFASAGGSGGGEWSKFAVTYLGPRITADPFSIENVDGVTVIPQGLDGGAP